MSSMATWPATQMLHRLPNEPDNKTGLIGTIVAAICCFTPLLVWIFVGAGLAGSIAYLDWFLFPMMGFFIVLMLWGYFRRDRS